MATKKIEVILIFLAVISLNLYFGFPRLEKFTAVDEALWSYDRVPKFWKSIKKGNWKGTSLCDKPGVTLAAISGMGLPFIADPQDYKELRSQAKTPEQLAEINNIYFFLRLPVYLFSLVSLFVFYYLIKRLWNKKIALLSVILIGLSPILLGISLIVNTDAILWILMPFSMLCFLIYQKEDNRKFLYLSGFILGLAILDKFVANFLFPFFLALIFLKHILSSQSGDDGLKYFRGAIKDYLIFVLISVSTIFIFYPSAWVKPIKSLLETTILSMAFEKIWPFFVGGLATVLVDTFLLKSFFSRKICAPFKNYKSLFIKITALSALLLILFVFLNVFQGMKYYNFEDIFFMPKPDFTYFEEVKSNLFSAFYPLIFGIPPLTSLFFIFSIIFLILAKKIEDKKYLFSTFSLLFFILIFYMANSSAQISSTVRYQIVVYPIVSILAAIGVWQFLNIKYIKKNFSENIFFASFVILILTSFFSLRSINPFFLSYSSELLPKQYIINPRDMADGSWEASQYLNGLPDAKNLKIWSDKKQVCEKFIGRCFKDTSEDQSFDYYVTSRSERNERLEEAKIKGTQEYKVGNDLVDLPKMYSENDTGNFFIAIGGRNKNYVKVTSASLTTKQ